MAFSAPPRYAPASKHGDERPCQCSSAGPLADQVEPRGRPLQLGARRKLGMSYIGG